MMRIMKNRNNNKKTTITGKKIEIYNKNYKLSINYKLINYRNF